MALKRVIAPDQFNLITGCYFEQISQIGHTPIKLVCRYYKVTTKESKKVPVTLDDRFDGVIKTHGTPYIQKTRSDGERSPFVHIHYNGNPNVWDEAINKVCAVWGKEAIVTEFVTENRDNGHNVCWQRHATENGRFNSKLVLFSINEVSWQKCSYKHQQTAAGEFWEDTCEFLMRKTEYESPVCKVGAH